MSLLNWEQAQMLIPVLDRLVTYFQRLRKYWSLYHFYNLLFENRILQKTM